MIREIIFDYLQNALGYEHPEIKNIKYSHQGNYFKIFFKHGKGRALNSKVIDGYIVKRFLEIRGNPEQEQQELWEEFENVL